MKRIFWIVLGLCLVLSMTACGKTAPADSAEIANPFTDCGTLADAAKIAGFEMTAPETLEGYPEKLIQAVDNSMIQVLFANGDVGQEGTDTVLLRKGSGSEDISGDYTDYETTESVPVGSRDVTVKGNGGQYFLATWQDGGYSYSVSVSAGTDLEGLTALVDALN